MIWCTVHLVTLFPFVCHGGRASVTRLILTGQFFRPWRKGISNQADNDRTVLSSFYFTPGGFNSFVHLTWMCRRFLVVACSAWNAEAVSVHLTNAVRLRLVTLKD